eukprot:scaffold84257_cov63-Phaeocystis_antarctica.AAC.1
MEHAVRSVYTISEFLFGHTDAVQGSSLVRARPRARRAPRPPPAARATPTPTARATLYPVRPPPPSLRAPAPGKNRSRGYPPGRFIVSRVATERYGFTALRNSPRAPAARIKYQSDTGDSAPALTSLSRRHEPSANSEGASVVRPSVTRWRTSLRSLVVAGSST